MSPHRSYAGNRGARVGMEVNHRVFLDLPVSSPGTLPSTLAHTYPRDKDVQMCLLEWAGRYLAWGL